MASRLYYVFIYVSASIEVPEYVVGNNWVATDKFHDKTITFWTILGYYSPTQFSFPPQEGALASVVKANFAVWTQHVSSDFSFTECRFIEAVLCRKFVFAARGVRAPHTTIEV